MYKTTLVYPKQRKGPIINSEYVCYALLTRELLKINSFVTNSKQNILTQLVQEIIATIM